MNSSSSKPKSFYIDRGGVRNGNAAGRGRCRIPQRMGINGSPTRQRMGQGNKPSASQGAVQNARSTPWSRSESLSRSSNRSESMAAKQLHGPRTSRPEIGISSTAKKGILLNNKKTISSTKRVTNNQKINKGYPSSSDPLPDQETIKKREDIEVQHGFNEKAKETTDLQQMNSKWIKSLAQFESLKSELNYRQKNIVELYSTMKNMHAFMSELGQTVILPPFDDINLNKMNITNLTADQLVQLCADGKTVEIEGALQPQHTLAKELEKFIEMPSKLVATCELTLHKRKEIIEWFQTLKSEEKGISVNKLTKKINEFTAENDALAGSLNDCKGEFSKELAMLVERLRKGVKEAVTLQVRIEELMYEISELNAQNSDLRKQLQAADHFKSPHNKFKIEELEKELREEKCKKTVIKDRLTRTEGQAKINHEKLLQMETALEQARAQNWTLERTVQQLNDQNQKLQTEFDRELCKLTGSIQDNTKHLEEIAEARGKLQTEKDDLEKRLQNMTENYNVSLSKMKEELIMHVAKVAVTEKKFEEETEERKNLESKLAELCSQLVESEIRYKEILNQMQRKDDQISRFSRIECELKGELNATKQKLEDTNCELADYRDSLQKQNQTIQEIEHNFQEMVELEKNLQLDIIQKQNYITELEKNLALLELKLQEGENKMEMYEKQLNSLKDELTLVHGKFGEFENVEELHKMVNDLRSKLIESTRDNGDLAKALQEKELELERYLVKIEEQKNILDQKDGILQKFKEKEEEKVNIIKLLRSNMEMRVKTDSDLQQQLAEKNAEINSLALDLEARKEQISQLEQIILTLEGQLRRVCLQRKKDQDKLTMLEKAITEYDVFPEEIKHNDAPTDNLDILIKTLEDELGSSFDPIIQNKNFKNKKHFYRNNNHNLRKCDQNGHCGEMRVDQITSSLEDKDSSQSVSRNTKNIISDDADFLDRKRAIMNIGIKRFQNSQPTEMYKKPVDYKTLDEKKRAVKVVQIMAGRPDDRRCKMMKLAVHNL